jgi:hypothetical protein
MVHKVLSKERNAVMCTCEKGVFVWGKIKYKEATEGMKSIFIVYDSV